MDTAKLFMNGNSQAVRLPKEYRFAGDEVVVKRLGNAVVLLPQDNPWQTLFDALAEFPRTRASSGTSRRSRRGRQSDEAAPRHGHLHLRHQCQAS